MATSPKSLPNPAKSITVGSSTDLQKVCPKCRLTAQALYDNGRMGCAVCYDTFIHMVEQAARELHSMPEAGGKTNPPTLPPDRNDSPWPTRKALSRRSSTR